MNVLFIGMGSIGKRHLRILKEMVPDSKRYFFKKEKEQSNEKNVFTHWEQVREITFDAAIISNPTHKHVETALKCANQGINLFVEKPVSHSMTGIEELKFIVQQNNLKTLVGFNLRFHPVIERLREIIQVTNERILRFSAYCGSYLSDWRETDYRSTYSASRDQGGGVVLDLIHELDYCTWLFGQPVEITGQCGKISGLEIDVEDTAELILRYKTCLGVIHLDYFRPVPQRTIEIITDRSVIEGDLLTGTITITGPLKTKEEHFEIYRDLTYQKQMAHFIDVIHDRVPP
ncbi:MAG: hypothetical protein CVV34_07075, partial [Methanomicrobiales archaeon HGW-Methanomicrobiales-5]